MSKRKRGDLIDTPITSVLERAVNPSGFKRQYNLISGSFNYVCRGTIPKSYIRSDAQESDFLFVTFYEGRVLNFATTRYLNQARDSLYVQVICAAPQKVPGGSGKALMQYIIAWARARKLKRIVLSALPQVINFYKTLNFDFKKAGTRAALVGGVEQSKTRRGWPEMKKPVPFRTDVSCADDLEIKAFENRFGIPQMKFSTLYDVDEDPLFMRYLNGLVKKGYAHDSNCKNARECNTNGYYMVLCL